MSAVDRAFELAKSGRCRSVSEIIRQLPVSDRRAVEVHLERPAARRELILICSAAWLAADELYADRTRPNGSYRDLRSRSPRNILAKC
jgi:hypothetical protein